MPEPVEQNQNQDQNKDQTQDQRQSDPEYWKSEAQKAFEARDAIKSRLRDRETELEKYKSEIEQTRAEKEAAARAKQASELEQQGKYKEALELQEKRFNETISQQKARVESRILPLAIKSAASKVKGITPEAMEDLPYLLRDHVGLDHETFEPFVKGDDGKPLTNEKLQPVTVDEFVTSFVTKRSYMLADSMPGRHGAKAPQDAKSFTIEQAMKDAKIYEEWEKADPEGLRAAEAAYLDPMAVARRERVKAEARRAKR